jgi:hypothetical protein
MLMSSSQLAALVALLAVSGAARAAEPPAPERQAGLIVPSVADLFLDAAAAPQGTGPDASGGLAERKLDGPRLGEAGVSPLKVRLGRTEAAGRSPGDAPPLYGEVGIDLEPRADLSLVPSYRVVLPKADARTEAEASAAQVLKLDARIRF